MIITLYGPIFTFVKQISCRGFAIFDIKAESDVFTNGEIILD